MRASNLREHFLVQLRAIDHEATLALSLATRLTHDHASYLWLSRHLSAPLITLDRALARAASA